MGFSFKGINIFKKVKIKFFKWVGFLVFEFSGNELVWKKVKVKKIVVGVFVVVVNLVRGS